MSKFSTKKGNKKRGTIQFLFVGVYGFEPQTLCL